MLYVHILLPNKQVVYMHQREDLANQWNFTAEFRDMEHKAIVQLWLSQQQPNNNTARKTDVKLIEIKKTLFSNLS